MDNPIAGTTRMLFWNSAQGRPRAPWRLILQILILLAVFIAILIVIGFVGIAALVVQGGSLDIQAVQAYFSNSPAFLALSSLAQFAAIVLTCGWRVALWIGAILPTLACIWTGTGGSTWASACYWVLC
jgi:amino acid transporter